jgi:hypothetical protein
MRPEPPDASPAAGTVRVIPFAVRSNTQARTTVTGKPAPRTVTTAVSDQSGR